MRRVLTRYPIASALREVWQTGYSLQDFKADCLAGLVVSIIAIPLAMALAIAVGVSPEQGLYTAIIAGPIIALLGGSRLSVSGPTAAFVTILYPIVQQHGVEGLLIATVMAGLFLITMGILKLGKWVTFIPHSVIVGFTVGIALTIASLQLKDFFGLPLATQSIHFVDRIINFTQLLPNVNLLATIIGMTTIFSMIACRRINRNLKISIPPHIVAVLFSTGLALALSFLFPESEIETIGSRFSEIPQSLPKFIFPWSEYTIFEKIPRLLGSAFAIAILGAIESLLCATILDQHVKTKHNPNGELIAQGIGNLVVPFFGGITATSAIARSIANFRAGGRSPISSVMHGLIVLLVVMIFGSLFSYVPMATLAGLLLKISWNISDVKQCVQILRTGSIVEGVVFAVTFILTVLCDMIVGVGIGVLMHILLTRIKSSSVDLNPL